LHGAESAALGDVGYQGVEKRPENVGKPVTWYVAMKRSKRKALSNNKLGRMTEKLEHLKASVRAKVEHPFHVIKNLFRHRKNDEREDFVRGPSHENAEIVLNLWAYSDEQGYVQRLAGKCDSLLGNDPEKLSVLRALAKSDYLSAEWKPVPKNYSVINGDGSEWQGVARTNEVMDEHAHVPLR